MPKRSHPKENTEDNFRPTSPKRPRLDDTELVLVLVSDIGVQVGPVADDKACESCTPESQNVGIQVDSTPGDEAGELSTLEYRDVGVQVRPVAGSSSVATQVSHEVSRGAEVAKAGEASQIKEAGRGSKPIQLIENPLLAVKPSQHIMSCPGRSRIYSPLPGPSTAPAPFMERLTVGPPYIILNPLDAMLPPPDSSRSPGSPNQDLGRSQSVENMDVNGRTQSVENMDVDDDNQMTVYSNPSNKRDPTCDPYGRR